jgi:hypothetical protein
VDENYSRFLLVSKRIIDKFRHHQKYGVAGFRYENDFA